MVAYLITAARAKPFSKLVPAGVEHRSALEQALRSRGAPVTVLEIPDRVAREVYGHDLLLVRPDLHVVSRGNAAPENAAEVGAIATEHG